MAEHKHPRQRGKVSFMKFFQQFKPGDSVAVVREQSEIFGYSKRMQGRTGRVLSQQGSAYCVEIADLGKPKRYFIKPVHLRRIAA